MHAPAPDQRAVHSAGGGRLRCLSAVAALPCSWYRSTGLLLWPRSKRLLVAAAADFPHQLLRLHNMLVSFS